jgi:hypothetical protein
MLSGWPGPLHRGADAALRARLSALAADASSLYSASDDACLYALLSLMLEAGAAQWDQYAGPPPIHTHAHR